MLSCYTYLAHAQKVCQHKQGLYNDCQGAVLTSQPCHQYCHTQYCLNTAQLTIFRVYFWHELSAFRQLTGNDVSGHYFCHYHFHSPPPPIFSSIIYFFHRCNDWMKKLISQKLTGAPKNLGFDAFPDLTLLKKV